MSQISRVSLPAGLGSLAAILLNSATLLALTPVPEVEPNNLAATATPLTLVNGFQAASGAISPGGDVDFYSFSAPTGSRVWALVDTGASSSSRDSILTLYQPNGVTQIETDDDDGIGNDCDVTIESLFASTIAGRTLTTSGTHFLSVRAFGPSEVITSYKLFVVVSLPASAESEPNDTAATANPIVTSGAPVGVRNGEITSITDADVYSVVAPAGSTLFISADGDPERNGGTDIVVDLLQPDGSTVILSIDNSDLSGIPPPPAESFCFNITTTGTYFVRVRGFQSQTKTSLGTYSLMVAAGGLPPTPTPTLTNTQVGGPSATPTPTATLSGPTATRTFTPIGGGPPADIPTLSFPMLAAMGLALTGAAFFLLRR